MVSHIDYNLSSTMLTLVIFFFVVSNSFAWRVSLHELGLNVDEIGNRRFLLTRNEAGELDYVDLLSQNVTHYAKEEDVTFHFYTQNNTESDEVFTVENYTVSKYFDPEKRTIFIIHGWINDYQSPVNILIKKNILNFYDVNVVVVDWSYVSKTNYITARLSVPAVGKTIAAFISKISRESSQDLSQFSLIGHSLGAHIAGKAGAELDGQVGYIVGLDPAGPLFSPHNSESRLDPTDASYVEVIHTSFLLGFGYPIGHVDFYPNGGNRQPGCGLDLDNVCAHGRAYEYYADSLRIRFLGHRCESYEDFQEGHCNSSKVALMGRLNADKRARGKYYLKTRSKEPYSMEVSH